MDEIIKVNDVSMRFNLAQEKTETLKEYTVKLLTHKLFFNEFYALKHVSFSMKRGESLALIGRNGSGKSTMLKVISGVMYPSGGSVAVNGEIAPMIELGAGFDMDLTARENIFLNGAVLGHDRDYMMAHFDRIIEFSELKDFVDVPVKNFSSGMIARLGFSIATEVQADILVCDEVLAVGDFMFQQKCHRRMEEMLSNGTTLLFVSHDRYFINRFATKVCVLEAGGVKEYLGNYDDYFEKINRQQAPDSENAGMTKTAMDKEKRKSREEEKRIREKKNAIAAAEKAIATAEEEAAEMEAQLADPATYQDAEKAAQLAKAYQLKKDEIERRYAEWEELSAEE